MLLALGILGGSWVGLAKAVIIIAAIVAIVLIVLRVLGLGIPDWFWQILLIILLVIVAIFAVDIIAGL